MGNVRKASGLRSLPCWLLRARTGGWTSGPEQGADVPSPGQAFHAFVPNCDGATVSTR